MSLLLNKSLSPLDLLEKKSLFKDYVQKNKSFLSTHSFVNVFIWKDFFQFRFETVGRNLCVFAKNEIGTFLYLPPLGECFSNSVIKECFNRMEDGDHRNGVSRIENVDQKQIALFSSGEYSLNLKSYDYIYYRRDIVDLIGNPYKDKRSLYNFFVKHYRYRFIPYEKMMQEECLHLYERWAQDHIKRHTDPIFLQMIEDNRIVHRTAFEFYRELGVAGWVVEVNGQLKGYTFGYPLSQDMFCVLFEIVDLGIKGLPVYIFREFCHDRVLQRYKFINAMDDFAMPNIEKTKLSYQPSFLLPSYTIRKKSTKVAE